MYAIDLGNTNGEVVSSGWVQLVRDERQTLDAISYDPYHTVTFEQGVPVKVTP